MDAGVTEPMQHMQGPLFPLSINRALAPQQVRTPTQAAAGKASGSQKKARKRTAKLA